MNLPPVLGERRAGLMLRLVLNGLTQAGATIGSALLVKLTFDRFIDQPQALSATSLVWFGLGFLVLALIHAGMRMLERIDAEQLGQGYVHQVRMVLYIHLSSLPPRKLQMRSRGSIMLRFVGDLTALRQWTSLGLARLIVAGVAIAGALLALALISWPLAVTVGAVVIPGTALSLVMGKPLLQAAREARRRRAFLAGNLNEQVASMAVVQVSGQTRREQNRIERQSSRLKTALILRAWVIGGLRAVTTATTAIATAATLITGALLVSDGQTTPGTVVAAMSIVGFLVPSLRDLGRVYEYWQGARVSIEKIHQFLDNPAPVAKSRGTSDLRDGAGHLVFSNVSVYGSLTDFSADAAPGSVIAVVGPNGAGKSTVLSLVARLVDAERGTVRLDGKDLGKLARDSLHRVVGIASPDLSLLRGTIRKNLRYRWRSAPEAELARVRELCGIDELLDELPDGEDTRIAEGGSSLSAGQRQRIVLARAILGNPPVLLLDEADVNLDPDASAVFNDILSNYKGTVMMVTHQLDNALRADVLWYMENGKLIATGRPDELLQSDSRVAGFFRLHEQQVLAS
ncbi:MAG TPA: ABC transporter ATP-binding protein [Gammaproteobacteria bacterium]|nr:ABC transporter ATP-binding protein [Gammaproteobacteria bacterium]